PSTTSYASLVAKKSPGPSMPISILCSRRAFAAGSTRVRPRGRGARLRRRERPSLPTHPRIRRARGEDSLPPTAQRCCLRAAPSCDRLVGVKERANPSPAAAQRDTVAVGPAKRPAAPRRPRTLLASAVATVLWCATVVCTPILVLVILAWWIAGRVGDVS